MRKPTANCIKYKSSPLLHAPAFLLCIAAVVGALGALYHPLIFLFLFPIARKKFVPAACVALATAAMVMCRVELPTDPIQGQGLFQIAYLKLNGSDWLYVGCWYPNGRAIPVRVILPDDPDVNRPPADRDWWVEGTATPRERGPAKLKISQRKSWKAIPGSWSFAEWRYHAKQRVQEWIHRSIEHPTSARFLAGISTGEFNDTELRDHFNRFGLQHIMAISGFHFTLIAAFLGFCLRLFMKGKALAIALIALLSGYCLFLGAAPSVLRAFTTLLLALIAQLLKRSISGVQALSIAVMALVVWDPLLLMTIGFPFSCLATASILLFYKPAEQWLQKVLPLRTLNEACSLTLLDQHGHYFAYLIRQMLALTAAVNLVAVPLALFYFGSFPLMGLLYNLFFPILVSVSMVLLMLSIPFPFLHAVNSWWTRRTLAFTENMPDALNITLNWDGLSPWVVGMLLVCLMVAWERSQGARVNYSPLK